MKTSRVSLLGLAGLMLAGLLAAGLLVVGTTRAQDEPDSAAESSVPESKAGFTKILEIAGIVGEEQIGFGFPFEQALRQLVADESISHEDVDAILSDLSSLTDAFNYESSISPDGNEVEVMVDVRIGSNGDDPLRPAMEVALDNAVAAGTLTAEQAAEVLEAVDAAPNPFDLDFARHGEAFHVGTVTLDGALEESELFSSLLDSRLNTAVSSGTISTAEAETFRDILQRILEEAE